MKKLKTPIKISGKVITGEKVGRQIGFPTANLDISRQTLKFPQGVYAAVATYKKKNYLSLAYYGPRYISHKPVPSFEACLLGFNQQIYGQSLTVKLTHFIRSPRRVANLQALKKLLQQDFKSLDNYVILINKQDQPLGIEVKTTAHLGKAKLHRAISVQIINSKGELLIQQRSKHKMLFPLYWANTVCTDVRPYETYQQAASRRLLEEFGLKTKLNFHHRFFYQAQYHPAGSERELDHFFIGFSDKKPQPNKQEIAAYQYISLPNLKKAIKTHPQNYAPWFKLALKKLPETDIFKA